MVYFHAKNNATNLDYTPFPQTGAAAAKST
jgi:hypothetical protein